MTNAGATALPRAEPAPGFWRSRGYGWALRRDGSGFTVRDVTAISNGLADHGPAGTFDHAFETVGDDPDPSVLRLRHRGDVTTYVFDAASPDRLPPPDPPDTNAVRNFEVLWRQFRDHYAFFDLRGVDWADAYARLRPHLDAGSGEEALWGVAADLVGPLRDAHVSIAAPGKTLDVTSPIRARKAAMQAAFSAPAWSADRQTYTDRLATAFGALFLGGRHKVTTNRMMVYGEIETGIGYLALFGEFGHADTDRARAALDLPRPRLAAADFLADEIAGLRRGLDEAVAALAGMKAVIVDIRMNYGGYDRLALDFAARFTDRSRLAYRKKTWCAGGVVVDQAIGFSPAGPSLSHLPVFLLTSRQTASAGEILTLALSACPNVTRVGEATLGILSDNLYKRLPNGWEVSLSNEIYQDPDGAVWEGVGIPPHVATPVFDPADIAGGLRLAVDAGLVLARTQ